jgi:hypothetical protein
MMDIVQKHNISAGELVKLDKGHVESPTPSSMSSQPSNTDEPAASGKV